MKNLALSIPILINSIFPVSYSALPIVSPIATEEIIKYRQEKEVILAEKTLDLHNRSKDSGVNGIFADNILLILHYLKGDVDDFSKDEKIDWEKIRKPFKSEFTLGSKDTFSFHDKVLFEYEGKVTKTIKVTYSGQEGFLPVDGLYGNGVCHLASLVNWTAKEAGLESKALVNHDFFPVEGVPREYGVSIYYTGESDARRQNLYITNNFDFPITFVFFSDLNKVELKIVR